MSDRNLQLQQKSLAERSKEILAGHPIGNLADNLAQLHADFLAQADELERENDAIRRALFDDQQAKTLITDINLKGGLNMQLKGGFAEVMASIFADQFRGSGAINYLELSFIDELGLELTVTLQKKTGKSPHQFRAEAESKALELEQQLADAQKDADKYRRHVKLIASESGKPGSRGNAPGHGHTIKGIWDSDNGAKAGKTCAWCAIWHDAIETTALLAKDKESK